MSVPQFSELIDSKVISSLAITNTVVVNKFDTPFHKYTEYIYKIKS